MIERLTGTVAVKTPDGVTIDLRGFGIRLEMSANSLRGCPATGERGEFLTHLHVREDDLQLFGFTTEEERDIFRLLIGVSKIGPKLALTVCSRRPDELRRAIATGDIDVFQSIPGIGKKTAERVILELREKVGEVAAAAAGISPDLPAEGDGNLGTARAALQELGLSGSEAAKLLEGEDAGTGVNELVRRALSRRRS